MRVLLTGAAGYTGRGLAEVLGTRHWVRGADLKDAGPVVQDMALGDLGDLDYCRRLLAGMEAAVLCHMAPNPAGYQAPPMAIDTNVKGTANLYHVAVELKITRFVMISTVGVLPKQPGARATPGDGPYGYQSGLYALTKTLQECVARYYYQIHAIRTALLRPGWIVYDGECVTKYGQRMDHYDPTLVDPRDIGQAVLAALALDDLGLEAFQLGQADSTLALDDARRRLGWNPQYRFVGLPRS